MTTTTAASPRGTSRGRKMLNKVPEVTIFFRVIKIMCTTVGETAAGYLNVNLGFGLTNTTYFTGALLGALLVAQFRLRRYVPPVYLVKGAVTLLDADGRQYQAGDTMALCRCGHSATKPFCDGAPRTLELRGAGPGLSPGSLMGPAVAS